jgi:oleate hydratase
MEGETAGTSTADERQVYIVGGGIAGLSAAVFAVRDGNIPGRNVHIFETTDVMGGALDGTGSAETYYVCRGARKVNYEVFNCMWDVLSGIPSLTDRTISVRDEVFEYNRLHKKNAKSRLIDKDRNKTDIPRYGPVGLGWPDRIRMLALIFWPESRIENRRIDSWFRPKFFKSNFWNVFSPLFAIEYWNDLVEMKRYMRRFMHAFPMMGMDGAQMVFPYNQYDSVVMPIMKWLDQRDVDFEMDCKVTDLDFRPSESELTVERIRCTRNGEDSEIAVDERDCVLATIGSMTADSRRGSMTQPAPLETGKLDGSWTLWENIAPKRPGLGNPSNFCDRVDESKWETFSVTSKDPTFFRLYEEFTGNRPGEADEVTFKDSSWHMSILVVDQPHFMNQPGDAIVWGGCGLRPDEVGDYVKKKMSDCTGKEILTEVCHQFGFIDEMPHILATSTCIPSMMPYEMSHFLPRKRSDRPPVVPQGSTNLAFMGQFTESDECVMLIESSVRCAQMGVYSLLGVDKKVPPVYTGAHSPVVWAKTLYQVFK